MSNVSINIDFKHYKEIVNIYINEYGLELENLEKNYNLYLQEYKNAFRQNNKELIPTISKKLSIYQKAIELSDILKYNYSENDKFFIP
jgi:predicted methyltransferase